MRVCATYASVSLLSHMQSVDIDAVIIGGWFGTGSRGGFLAQYLLALLEQPDTPGRAPVFLSFCKCAAPDPYVLVVCACQQLRHEHHLTFRLQISSDFISPSQLSPLQPICILTAIL